jgi:hypothetical protein
MDPALLVRFEKLAAAGVSLLPTAGIPNHFVFTRDGMAVLVERRGGGFGGIGSPGRITERGFEPLVYSSGGAHFVFKAERAPATAADIIAARFLLADLKSALA